jgi:hypothetical protein
VIFFFCVHVLASILLKAKEVDTVLIVVLVFWVVTSCNDAVGCHAEAADEDLNLHRRDKPQSWLKRWQTDYLQRKQT